MKLKLNLASFALAMGLSCLSTESASAQAKQAVSNVTVVGTSQKMVAQDDSAARARKNPMGWAGIGVKVGAAGVTSGKLTIMGQEGRTAGRMGLQVAVPITLGGDGFGWSFEPYYMKSTIAHDAKNSQGNVTGNANVDLTSLGMYTGPIFNVHVMDPLYIGFGFGVKGAYLMNKGFDYAADLYGRVPVHATYYFNRTVAMTAEVGFGYGASAFADKPRVMVDPVSRSLKNVKDDPLFGLAYTWDATIGFRVP